MGLAYLSLGLYSPAESQIKRSLPRHDRIYGPEHLDVAMNLHHLSLIYLERGEAAATEPLSRQALRLILRATTGLVRLCRGSSNSMIQPGKKARLPPAASTVSRKHKLSA